jgi:2,3-diketo-5-methylthiopentyl-1-phosphate enolase
VEAVVIDFDRFMLPEQVGEDHLLASYLAHSSTDNGMKLAASLASEQTTGTWVEVPGGEAELLARHAGQVVAVQEVPSHETGARSGERCFLIQIAYPWRNFGPQLPMLLTTVFGNISMFGKIKLLDIQVPKALSEALPGPRFGIEGIRELLGVPDRPLLNTMIKPSIGLTPEQGAELLYRAAVGGTDIIKDDEVLADTGVSPFLRRLSAYLRKLERAESETGEKKLYAINVTDEPARSLEKAEAAVQSGARAVMVNYLPSGLGLVSSLARSPRVKVPILGHLDFGGALYASPFHGVSSALLYGKLPRLAGIDLLTIPTPYGKFDLSLEKYLGIVLGLRRPLHRIRRTFPIAGGGIRQGDLPRLLQDLGPEFIIGAGGAIYAHPMGATAGARAFRQSIEVLMRGDEFRALDRYPELKAALEKWGGALSDG